MAWLLLALVTLVSNFSLSTAHNSELSGRSLEPISELPHYKRQSGCGPTAGNAVCPQGLCCGPNGVCGTGGYYCDAPDCQYGYSAACQANAIPSGPNTTNTPRPRFGTVPYGVNIVNCSVPGKLALTLDDGPYLYTSQVLDILKQANVSATFFVVANNGGKGEIDITAPYPSIIRRMVTDGHQVGSHSFSHQDLAQATPQQRHDQIVKNEIVLTNILGFFPTYLRPPYYDCSVACYADLLALGYHVTNYNIDTLDWQGNYPASDQNFLKPLQATTPQKSSFVPLAHDIHQLTVTQFVPFMIANARQMGYQFTTVGQCLGDPVGNWYRDPVSGLGVPDPAASVNKIVAGGASAGESNLPTATSAGNFGDASTPTAAAAASASASAAAHKNGAAAAVDGDAASHLGVFLLGFALLTYAIGVPLFL